MLWPCGARAQWDSDKPTGGHILLLRHVRIPSSSLLQVLFQEKHSPKHDFPETSGTLSCWWERIIRLFFPTMMECLLFWQHTSYHSTPTMIPAYCSEFILAWTRFFIRNIMVTLLKGFVLVRQQIIHYILSTKPSPAPVRHRIFVWMDLHANPKVSLVWFACSPPEHLAFTNRRGISRLWSLRKNIKGTAWIDVWHGEWGLKIGMTQDHIRK